MTAGRLQRFTAVFLAAAALAAAALAWGQPPDQRQKKLQFTVRDISAFELQTAFNRAEQFDARPQGVVQAGILPHHLLVAPVMAGWFYGLDRQPAPKTVVIIGPDHQNRASGYAVTSRAGWRTAAGDIGVDETMVQRLIQGGIPVDETTVEREHGVYAAIPFVRKTWPSAKIVLIAVRGEADEGLIEKLAGLMDELLRPRDLILATVDFSHYKPLLATLEDDRISLPVIERLDAVAAMNIPVDSPPAISLLLRYANKRGLRYQQIVHTNSGQFTGQLSEPSMTSYLTAYFYQAKK